MKCIYHRWYLRSHTTSQGSHFGTIQTLLIYFIRKSVQFHQVMSCSPCPSTLCTVLFDNALTSRANNCWNSHNYSLKCVWWFFFYTQIKIWDTNYYCSTDEYQVTNSNQMYALSRNTHALSLSHTWSKNKTFHLDCIQDEV